MFENTIKQEDAIAFFRFTVISPILEAERGKIDATVKKLAQQQFNDVVHKKMVGFSCRTLYAYYMNYKKHGFDGLKPKQYKNKGTHPSIPKNVIKAILELKEELPTRSAAKIITMLELAKRVEKDVLQVRTVNRILKHYGYTTQVLKKKNRVYLKHEKQQINAMWQSDVMGAFYLPNKNNEKKLTYLIAFIDDHSRRITHGQFYFDATLNRLEDCLRKAVTKCGAPTSAYFDNGKIYVSNNFKLICARLGITLKYAKAYHPEGKGKIEKFWNFVQTSFLSEIKVNRIDNIIELNDLFAAWLKKEYHDKVHTSLGVTPLERWEKSLQDGAQLRYFSPVQIDEAFLHYDERLVTKYGTISFLGNTYEVDGVLVNKQVGLRYNPFHLEQVHIYYQDQYFGLARIIDLNRQKHRDVNNIEEDPEVDSDISRQYFEHIKSDYQSYLEEQLNTPLTVDDKQSLEQKPISQDDTIYHAPDEPTQAISRDEFVTIISSSLDDELTFAEKGKIHELWQTFKEFNRELLISIIEDIKDKTPDYNRSFLYYLSQIKSIYLEKTNQGGR